MDLSASGEKGENAFISASTDLFSTFLKYFQSCQNTDWFEIRDFILFRTSLIKRGN